jgi:hypothetical protein
VTDTGVFNEVFLSRRGELPTPQHHAIVAECFERRWREWCLSTPHAIEEIRGAANFLKRLVDSQGWSVSVATGGFERLKIASARLLLADCACAFRKWSTAASDQGR